LLWIVNVSRLKRDTHFLIFALGNDIQLTLAAIFNVIVSKRCVKFCGSWMQCAALRLAFLLVFSNTRFLRLTCLSQCWNCLYWHCTELAYCHQLLTPSVLIGRLINAHQHLLALKISEYLGMNQVSLCVLYELLYSLAFCLLAVQPLLFLLIHPIAPYIPPFSSHLHSLLCCQVSSLSVPPFSFITTSSTTLSKLFSILSMWTVLSTLYAIGWRMRSITLGGGVHLKTQAPISL